MKLELECYDENTVFGLDNPNPNPNPNRNPNLNPNPNPNPNPNQVFGLDMLASNPLLGTTTVDLNSN